MKFESIPIFQLKKKVAITIAKTLLPIAGILILLSFSKPEKTYKLLIYAIFEDSLKLQSGDTNLIHGNICIKLKVDTVDMAYLKKDFTDKMASQPNNWYIYKGHYMLIHTKDQLFELNEYKMVKNFDITEFDMLKIGSWDQSSTSYSNCLSDNQKKTIKDCWKIVRNHTKESNFEFLICRLKVINSITKRTLDFPGITFQIMKH